MLTHLPLYKDSGRCSSLHTSFHRRSLYTFYWNSLNPTVTMITLITLIAQFMGPTWGPPGSCWHQMATMLAPWTLLSGKPQTIPFDEEISEELYEVDAASALLSITDNKELFDVINPVNPILDDLKQATCKLQIMNKQLKYQDKSCSNDICVSSQEPNSSQSISPIFTHHIEHCYIAYLHYGDLRMNTVCYTKICIKQSVISMQTLFVL